MMEIWDILLQQETQTTDYINNQLDLITEGNIAMTSMPATQCTNLTGGRPSGGLAMFWRSTNNLTCETIRYMDLITGLTLETNYLNMTFWMYTWIVIVER